MIGDVYQGLQTAIRGLDDLSKWAAFIDTKLAEAGKTGRLLTTQEKAAIVNIRARWVAYGERLEAILAATMPGPDDA